MTTAKTDVKWNVGKIIGGMTERPFAWRVAYC